MQFARKFDRQRQRLQRIAQPGFHRSFASAIKKLFQLPVWQPAPSSVRVKD